MRKITYILTVVLMNLLVLSSCERESISYSGTEDNTQTTVEGEGRVSFAAVKLTIAEVSISSGTRAGTNFDDYTILIEGKNSTYSKSWRFGDMPEVIEMNVGEYTLTAYSHTPTEPEFDRPCYKGTQDFKIVADEITYIDEVKCTLQSIMVTVEYDDELATLLGDDVKAEVTLMNGGSLEFAKGEERAGYYAAVGEGSNNTLKATLTGTVDGAAVNYSESFSGVKAGEHRIIRFTLKKVNSNGNGTGGSASFEITIDAECTIVPIEVNITTSIGQEEKIEDFPQDNDEEDNSGDNQGGDDNSDSQGGGSSDNSDQPTIAYNNEKMATATKKTFDINKDIIDVTLSTQEEPVAIVVDIIAPKGIANLNVEIISEQLDATALEEVNMASKFDLVYPEKTVLSDGTTKDLTAALKGFEFPVGDEVKGQTTLQFDITSFTPLLTGYTGEHDFKLIVTDADGNKATGTIRTIVK
jgi:hypothetical protein